METIFRFHFYKRDWQPSLRFIKEIDGYHVKWSTEEADREVLADTLSECILIMTDDDPRGQAYSMVMESGMVDNEG